MLQTSYSTNWAVSGAYDKIYASFSNTNQYQIEFTVQLSSTTTQFGFGCDTQLGDYTTSGSYSDWAALIAYLNDDKSLKQIAMMGSASEESAEDDDPAFVIAPVTGNALFWIGRYNSRQMFAYNTSVLSGCRTTEINGQNVATAVENTDSGMTMSWVGLTAGSRISFNFGVGSVANTGARKHMLFPHPIHLQFRRPIQIVIMHYS